MNKGVMTWFETIWSYGVEAIDYWIIWNKIETEIYIGVIEKPLVSQIY